MVRECRTLCGGSAGGAEAEKAASEAGAACEHCRTRVAPPSSSSCVGGSMIWRFLTRHSWLWELLAVLLLYAMIFALVALT